ncbi:MAG TPA: precorrin-3B synthase, partial [Mesorhizobium sp.]
PAGEPTSPAVEPNTQSPISVFNLINESLALGVGLPFGSMPAGKLVALVRKSIELGCAEIRLAPGRALLFPGLCAATSQSLQMAAAELGFITKANDPRTRIAACPGAPACASGMIETRNIAEEIAATQMEFLDPSFTLHISGCAKGCAHPAAARLTLVGGEKGAGLVVDGTAKSLPVGYRPRYDGARGVSRVAAAARAACQPGDTAASSLARLGAAAIAQAYRQE